MLEKHYCFTGGGTGGHVYPAKPIIDEILEKDPEAKIHWIGSRGGMEQAIVQSWGIHYLPISSGKLRRYFSLQNFTDMFRILAGFFQARRALRKIKPLCIFSKGGFVSVPPLWAARTLKIPAFSHDSDMDPGLATKLNSSFSKKIFVAYEDSLKYYAKHKDRVVVSGNPLRSQFFQGDAQLGKEFFNYNGSKPILLVIGGSLGAQEINQWVWDNLDRLCKSYFVVHQTGKTAEPPKVREDYRSFSYIYDELPHVMEAADLALSRAGAGSLWELAATGTPMMLLPLRQGSRGDQERNAQWFANAGFAKVAEQEDLTDGGLADTLEKGTGHQGWTAALKQNLKNNPLPRATELILQSMEEVITL